VVVVAVACDIHAERHLAKAGGSNCKLRGIPTLVTKQGGVERAKRSGGLHKRSAEDWGNGLRARGAELPLEVFAVAFRLRVAGSNDPQRFSLKNQVFFFTCVPESIFSLFLVQF